MTDDRIPESVNKSTEADLRREASAPGVSVHVVRLGPGEDLKRSLAEMTRAREWRAAFVMSIAGSLDPVILRLAGADAPTTFPGRHEIVSLGGTLCPTGLHLHLSAADESGRVIGGHLVDGCVVYTTAEIVIGLADAIAFRREMDPRTGFLELFPTQGNS